jgi:hypothetical protein
MTGDTQIARIYLQLAGLGLTDADLANRVLRSHRRRVARFTAAWKREAPGLTDAEAAERAQTTLAALSGFALTALIDADFDMGQHARALLPEPGPTSA